MKKIILVVLLINLINAEELTQSERMQSAVIDGMIKGVTGIFNQTVKTVQDPQKIVNNVKEYREERKDAQLKYYKKQHEVRGKAILNMNEKRNKLIAKYNELKEENRELKKTIKKYNMYYKIINGCKLKNTKQQINTFLRKTT